MNRWEMKSGRDAAAKIRGPCTLSEFEWERRTSRDRRRQWIDRVACPDLDVPMWYQREWIYWGIWYPTAIWGSRCCRSEWPWLRIWELTFWLGCKRLPGHDWEWMWVWYTQGLKFASSWLHTETVEDLIPFTVQTCTEVRECEWGPFSRHLCHWKTFYSGM